jgi:hypothetical protein
MEEKDNNRNKSVVSWRDYVDTRILALEQATNLAAKTLEKRLEGMNEFREALKNQASLFITRSEMELEIEKMEKDIRVLRESKANLEGKASQISVVIALAISILGLFVGIIGLIYKFR